MFRGILKLFFTYSKHQIFPKNIVNFVPLEWSIYRLPAQLKGYQNNHAHVESILSERPLDRYGDK